MIEHTGLASNFTEKVDIYTKKSMYAVLAAATSSVPCPYPSAPFPSSSPQPLFFGSSSPASSSSPNISLLGSPSPVSICFRSSPLDRRRIRHRPGTSIPPP